MIKVYVKWIDSGYSLRGDIWQTEDEIEDLLKELKEVETVGFLIQDNSEWIVLAQSRNLDMVRGGYIIYKKNIVEFKQLDFFKN